MSMTRRTLIRNLTALSALPLVSGLDGPAAFAVSGFGFQKETAAPDPNSIFVLFEGPWIIHQPDSSMKTIKASTFGHLDEPWPSQFGSVHSCPVGLGTCGEYSLSNPQDGNSMQLPLELGVGGKWSVIAPGDSPGSTGGYSTAPKSLAGLFGGLYGEFSNKLDPFVYITNSGMAVAQDHDDRTVTLPTPARVWIGGALTKYSVTGSNLTPASSSTKPPSRVTPYFVVFLEYQTDGNGNAPDLRLNPTGHAAIKLQGGNSRKTHLIFRMTHSDTMQLDQHVHAAHNSLRRRIGNWGGDGTGLDLTLTSSTTPLPTTQGNNFDGFDVQEMGMMGSMPKGERAGPGYADCCGGGIILGN